MEDNNQPLQNAENKDEITDYFEGVKQLEIQGYESGIKKARNALFITAAIIFISELISALIADISLTPLFWGIVLIESGIFVGLAFLTKQRPYLAVILGLELFILLWVLGIYVSGIKAAYSGLIFKIIIIATLSRALTPAKDWEEAKRNS